MTLADLSQATGLPDELAFSASTNSHSRLAQRKFPFKFFRELTRNWLIDSGIPAGV